MAWFLIEISLFLLQEQTKNEDNSNSIVMQSADTLFDGSIPRQKVAQVCVEALFEPAAKNKIVEIVARENTPAKSFGELFANVV